MIEFILNNTLVKTDLPSGTILLDFIRKNKQLAGTKIGCREGDCGACTVLAGSLGLDSIVNYETIVSCLTPIANVHCKHIVTIEGLNLENGLTPIQDSVVKNNATQCGFCTPGFIVSFTGYSLSSKTTIDGMYESISGNICRCTGYKSIKKAGEDIFNFLQKNNSKGIITDLIEKRIIPDYFLHIPKRLKEIDINIKTSEGILVAGGTDIYVTNASELGEKDIQKLSGKVENNIIKNGDEFIINAGATATDIANNQELNDCFPNFKSYFNLISSMQIRNMGTIGGNIVNASPIADLAIIFLALNSRIELCDENNDIRSLNLKDFYKDYKSTDLKHNEVIKCIQFNLTQSNSFFNFEKVSKRTHLDIASVNSAINLNVENGKFKNIKLSAGGVAPIPLYLKNTSEFLTGKELSSQNIKKGHCVLKEEISPISDVRGSKEYKSLLLKQLYFSHFIKLFPEIINIGDIK